VIARRRGRLLAVAGSAAAVAVLVAGIVLARDGGSARPVARGSGETAGTAADGGERSDTASALELSGTDPVTGEPVSLADFDGMPIVLNFWASWCPPCREELPALVAFAEAHPKAAVVGVNFQDDPAAARDLQRDVGFDFPSIADPSGEIGAQLGIQGMPTTYFLDARHTVVALVTGGTDVAGFEQGLRLAVEGP
jgi:thiol-disulfide isomerase/thioredoxin